MLRTWARAYQERSLLCKLIKLVPLELSDSIVRLPRRNTCSASSMEWQFRTSPRLKIGRGSDVSSTVYSTSTSRMVHQQVLLPHATASHVPRRPQYIYAACQLYRAIFTRAAGSSRCYRCLHSPIGIRRSIRRVPPKTGGWRLPGRRCESGSHVSARRCSQSLVGCAALRCGRAPGSGTGCVPFLAILVPGCRRLITDCIDIDGVLLFSSVGAVQLLHRLEELQIAVAQGSSDEYLAILKAIVKGASGNDALRRLQRTRFALAKYYAACTVMADDTERWRV